MTRSSLDQIRERFETQLQQAVASLSWEGRLKEAIRYAVSGGGKRVRPLFLLALLCDLAGEPSDAHFRLAASVELLHTASLIHDDLPALDNDDLRRGRATVHRAFDEPTALLAADLMVPTAIAWCLEIDALSHEQRTQLSQVLATAYADVCHGQMLDCAITGASSRQELLEVHRYKTSALYRAAAQLASVAGNFTAEQSERIIALGQSFGHFFQMADDFLDLDDGRPNIFSGCALTEIFQQLDAAWLTVEQSLMTIESLTLKHSLTLTREVCELVRERLQTGGSNDGPKKEPQKSL